MEASEGRRLRGGSATSSEAAGAQWTSAKTGREFGRANGPQQRLVRQLLQPARLAWLKAQVCAAEGVGLSGVADRGFCDLQWRLHFNQATTSNTVYATVAESDAVGKECRVIIRQLGESLVRSVQGARGDARWGVARPPEGWQVSLGGMRPGHIDPSHLGHLILTVTLEGDCVIGVQRQRGEPAPPGDGRWVKQVQRQFDYYAIWGDSIEPHKIKHRVDAGHQQRLSITMRFVNSIPLTVPEEEDGDPQWRVGDACSAFWRQEAWYVGQVVAISPDRLRADVRYADGDHEAQIPFSRLRPAVGAAAVAMAATQQGRRERYERRKRKVGGASPPLALTRPRPPSPPPATTEPARAAAEPLAPKSSRPRNARQPPPVVPPAPPLESVPAQALVARPVQPAGRSVPRAGCSKCRYTSCSKCRDLAPLPAAPPVPVTSASRTLSAVAAAPSDTSDDDVEDEHEEYCPHPHRRQS